MLLNVKTNKNPLAAIRQKQRLKVKVKVKKKQPPLKPDGRNILIVGKKKGQEAEEELLNWLATPSGFLEGYGHDEMDNPLSLYNYQTGVMFDPSFFVHGDKARQIGWSFGNAGEAVAKAHLQSPQTSIFISINQEEANEKIVFAKAIFDSLPLRVKKRCVVDNKKSLEFEDANGDRRSRTRLISHAQREPRGKGGNTDVYLDESAHYIYGYQIYVAAVPIITRGTGRLVTGSTPLGKQGIHFMLKNESRYRRIFSYHEIYWWNCPELVADGKFDEAQLGAKFLTTQERVIKYGSDKLIAIYISMPEDQFKQEYELYTIDETVSYFPLDLIHSCCYEVPIDPIFAEEDEVSEPIEGLYDIVKHYPSVDFKLYESIEDLALAVQKNKVSPKLYGGFDVGRVRHNAEFVIMEEIGDLQVIRYVETFDNLEFHKQKAYHTNVLKTFPMMKLGIDHTGMGMNLAEDLWLQFRNRVYRVNFTNDWKEQASTNVHIRMEGQSLAIPYIKKVVQQTHAIKRKITEHGNFRFDVEKNPNHHGDIYWAIALATEMGSPPNIVRAKLAALTRAKAARMLKIPQIRIAKSPMTRVTRAENFGAPRIESQFVVPEVIQ